MVRYVHAANRDFNAHGCLMTVMVDGASVRAVTQGILVETTAAVPASGASADLFTVDTGSVLLVGFWGDVESVLPADTDLSVHFEPDDGGSNTDLATTLVADIDVTGSIYTLNPTAGGALVVGIDVAFNAILEDPIVLTLGDILLTSAGGGTGGGSIHWYAIYAPLDADATMAAS